MQLWYISGKGWVILYRSTLERVPDIGIYAERDEALDALVAIRPDYWNEGNEPGTVHPHVPAKRFPDDRRG